VKYLLTHLVIRIRFIGRIIHIIIIIPLAAIRWVILQTSECSNQIVNARIVGDARSRPKVVRAGSGIFMFAHQNIFIMINVVRVALLVNIAVVVVEQVT
jgi:hypothetical protein